MCMYAYICIYENHYINKYHTVSENMYNFNISENHRVVAHELGVRYPTLTQILGELGGLPIIPTLEGESTTKDP